MKMRYLPQVIAISNILFIGQVTSNLVISTKFENATITRITSLVTVANSSGSISNPVGYKIYEENNKNFIEAGLKCTLLTGITPLQLREKTDEHAEQYAMCIYKHLRHTDEKGITRDDNNLYRLPTNYNVTQVVHICKGEVNGTFWPRRAGWYEEMVHSFVLCVAEYSPVNLLENITTTTQRPMIRISLENKKKVMETGLKCIMVTGITPFQVVDRNEEEQKKYAYCLFTHLGYASKKGTINRHNYLALIPDDKLREEVEKAVAICKYKVRSVKVPEDKIYEFNLCIKEHSPVTILLA